jgi:hypothetical protein
MKNMVTNILTKELYANKHEYFQHLMGVVKCVTHNSLSEGVGYQLLTKLLLPSYNYLRYLYYMHIHLRL